MRAKTEANHIVQENNIISITHLRQYDKAFQGLGEFYKSVLELVLFSTFGREQHTHGQISHIVLEVRECLHLIEDNGKKSWTYGIDKIISYILHMFWKNLGFIDNIDILLFELLLNLFQDSKTLLLEEYHLAVDLLQ